MKTHLKWLGIATVIMLFAGCSTVSGILPTSSGGDDNAAGSSSDNAAATSQQNAAAEDSFLNSSDYSDDDEIVGVFLKDADYARMTEDFELNDVEFDWGWAAPGLDVSKYTTVYVSAENDSDALDPDVQKYVRRTYTLAMKRLGLKPVSSASRADLVLGLAVVDYNDEYTYAFVTMIPPFIEIELRLADRRTGQDLLLIRDQQHASSPKSAAADCARDVLKALR